MSHNIFGSRFADNRQAAWHGLGTVMGDDTSATEALRIIGGDVETVMVPVAATVAGETIDLADFRAAMRRPTADDPEWRCFNVVSDAYDPITMTDLAMLFDEFVARPVETIGILGIGDRGFITTKLPEIDVKGDPVEMYLGATYSYTAAASAEVWPLRVVCQNTLRAAQARATATYRVVHGPGARARMGEWVADVYREADAKVAVLTEAFNALAEYTPTRTQTTRIIEAAYPYPNAPRTDAPADIVRVRQSNHEWRKGRVDAFRTGSLELFRGAGTGMDTVAARGTGWGLVNAIAETESYRRGSNKGAGEDANVGEQVMFGKRGAAMIRATDTALAYAGS